MYLAKFVDEFTVQWITTYILFRVADDCFYITLAFLCVCHVLLYFHLICKHFIFISKAFLPEAKHSADDHSVLLAPLVITDAALHVVMRH